MHTVHDNNASNMCTETQHKNKKTPKFQYKKDKKGKVG